MKSPVAVIGAGAWGTALACLLAEKGETVRLWEYFPEYAKILQTTRENPKFLPGAKIPEAVLITHDLTEAAKDCELLVLAVPSQAMRSVNRKLSAIPVQPQIIVSASKGIENTSLKRMSQIIRETFETAAVCALSGPSHAEEVIRGIPTSVVVACRDLSAAETVQKILTTDQFRIYTSRDVIGVEMGGALKNVIAIAAGIVDGLKLGDNTKAALITRGLTEMNRLGRAMQAHPETFSGLSGLGDLVVTCTSRHSRNRRVGEELGKGRHLKEILADMEMVAEGVETARSVRRLAEELKVDTPIMEEVSKILFEEASPREALKRLMQRPYKAEPEIEKP